ncbi:rhodanese-like domain-containing protein [Amycolatopsis sp. TNS106]|uniref:rhodanese-like domain-containing protein n=1 Tax=Amycolatopsis sp. TNS106 TaxID=2861750 RepID=UPI001C55BE2A|nr:rhodanese-like domain-containing protein [Amycolatopsis sp. TNS106]QXV62867.1 sulfurtransferase [Amycolatopsis sp. TNS106]
MDTISGLLERVRENITRYEPDAAAERLRGGALLIDLRPLEFRLRNGDIPGAIAVSRHVLEWRLDVTSSWRLKELAYEDYDQEVILLCNEGYTSSLAAHQVMSAVGLRAVGDVVGGFAAWKAAGHPVVERSAVE